MMEVILVMLNMKSLLSKIFLISVFAIAMAHVEAVAVVYLREMVKDPGVMLGPPYYFIEQTREAATIIMLAAFAILIGKSFREKLGVFLLAFGVWDIFYYISLYIMLGWPANLLVQDVLFLIPAPWIAPVVLPVSISVLMILSGYYLLSVSRT